MVCVYLMDFLDGMTIICEVICIYQLNRVKYFIYGAVKSESSDLPMGMKRVGKYIFRVLQL